MPSLYPIAQGREKTADSLYPASRLITDRKADAPIHEPPTKKCLSAFSVYGTHMPGMAQETMKMHGVFLVIRLFLV